MGTRSHIGILQDNGTVKYSYCHWDGSTSHNGRILLENIKTREEAEKLIDMGGQSSIAWIIDPESKPNICGDDPARMSNSIDDYLTDVGDIEYSYLFDPKVNRWFVASCHAPIAKNYYKDTENLFTIPYYLPYEFPYELTKKFKANSVYGKASKKLYPVELLLAYELINGICYLESKNPNYANVYKENLSECLELGLIPQDVYEHAQRLDQETEAERLAGLTKLQQEISSFLYEIEMTYRKNREIVNKNTTTYDCKETAKVLRLAFKTAGIRNLSVTSSHNTVYISHKGGDENFTQEEADSINCIIAQFDAYTEKHSNAIRASVDKTFIPESQYKDYAIIHFDPYIIKNTDTIAG